MNKLEKTLSKMSLKDKIALCSGKDFWHTKEMKEYGIQSFMMNDGPHGLRKQTDETDMLGVNESVPATSFPTSATTACSWDTELIGEVAEAVAMEALANDVAVVLGPGANIKRNPLCGRNFEYFSEDTYLTGKMAASYIKNAERTGASSSLKHFALNNQENRRFVSDSIIDERTMREIYLSGFEMAVKEGKPSTVMCAYNKINGVHCSDNKKLLTDILRDEWGFDGLVVTDWGAMDDRMKAFEAGCDLCMPGGSSYMEKETLQAVEKGEFSESYINQSTERMLRMLERVSRAPKVEVDMEEHMKLAGKVATESAVLLKNKNDLLPVKKEDVVFIGAMAKNMRYQGAGSSHINPYKLCNPLDACGDIPFAKGCNDDGSTSEQLIAEAVEAAAGAKTAVVFAGLTDKYESEGFDREHMKMPEGHIRMIEAVAKANKNTVVVLMCGSVVEMPWADHVSAILYMGLSGVAGGAACCDLLFGRAVPCGKLAETWAYTYEDYVNSDYYSGNHKDAHYREGIYVGYRYFDKAQVPVRYPFGYGLSYSKFEYSDISMENNKVFCTVKNIGKYPAKEIVQLYVKAPEGKSYRAVKELKGFRKVFLNPGEEKTVSFELNDRAFSIWNNGWIIPKGTYEILIGGSSDHLPLSCTLEAGDDMVETKNLSDWYYTPKGKPDNEDFEKLYGKKVCETPLVKGKFTMENTVMEMKEHSLIMKIMYKAVEKTVAKGCGGKADYSNPEFRMLINSSADSSLSSMKISGGMRNYLLEGMLEMANGHFLKGIITMCKKY